MFHLLISCSYQEISLEFLIFLVNLVISIVVHPKLHSTWTLGANYLLFYNQNRSAVPKGIDHDKLLCIPVVIISSFSSLQAILIKWGANYSRGNVSQSPFYVYFFRSPSILDDSNPCIKNIFTVYFEGLLILK